MTGPGEAEFEDDSREPVISPEPEAGWAPHLRRVPACVFSIFSQKYVPPSFSPPQDEVGGSGTPRVLKKNLSLKFPEDI